MDPWEVGEPLSGMTEYDFQLWFFPTDISGFLYRKWHHLGKPRPRFNDYVRRYERF